VLATISLSLLRTALGLAAAANTRGRVRGLVGGCRGWVWRRRDGEAFVPLFPPSAAVYVGLPLPAPLGLG
jgi:hypothetical protein